MIENPSKFRLHECLGRVSVVAVVATLTAAGPAAPAAGQTVSSGDSRLSLTISGQVNRAILYADDGGADGTDLFFVDNADNLSSRLRAEGTGRFDPEIFAGAVFEGQFATNPTTEISIGQSSSAGSGAFTARVVEIYIDHAGIGRFTIGRGETASNGTSEVDLSGTELAGYSLVSDFAGGIAFTGGPGGQIVDEYTNMDGFGLDDRFRYDSPSIGGVFKVSASRFEEDDGWDVAARYAGQVGGFQVAAAVGYGDTDSITQINGSLSAIDRSSGISVTVAGGSQNTGGVDDPTFLYGKLGYQLDLFSFGTTALAADYATASIGTADETFTSIGVLAVQNIDRISTDLYAALRTHSFEENGNEADNIGGLMVGARVKF